MILGSYLSNPINCPWGRKAFTSYLGNNRDQWRQYDACELVSIADHKIPMLVDQGENDNFLQDQLKPASLLLAANKSNYPLTLKMQPGYDHSYYFIASFIEDHLRFHALNLGLIT